VEKEWYICPYCGQKILQHTKEAVSKGFFIKCKKCKKEIEIKKEK
jgi:transcription elongation factor Elf1